MASITGMSNSNYVSSLYNSANTITGLASGLDTESMIENLTKSYQTKITQLQQKQTKLTWKQDAYRSIIAKMYAFTNSYTSYTSSTNIMSQAFWSSARTSAVMGANASKVTASGITSSDVVLNSVDQLAASARYVTQGNFNTGDGSTITASKGIDLTGQTEVSSLNGSLSLVYGTQTVSIRFSESDIIEPKGNETNAEALARVINEKLSEQTIALTSSSVPASDRIVATVNDDFSISFSENPANKAGNNVYISSSTGNLAEKLNLPDLSKASTELPASFTIDKANMIGGGFFTEQANNIEKISGMTVNMNLDGTTKQITLPKIYKNNDAGITTYQIGEDGKPRTLDELDELNKDFVNALNSEVQKQFGKKVEVVNADSSNQSLQLQFNVAEGSDLLINTDAGDALGIGNTATNYLNTSKTLGELGFNFNGLAVNKDGKYDFEINGQVIGSYDKDTKLSEIMNDINSKSTVNVSYSKTSREFVFTSKDTGEHTEVSLGNGLASAMFGSKFANQSGKKVSDVFKDALGDDFDGTLKGQNFSLTVNDKTYDLSFNSDSGTMDQLLSKINKALAADGLEASYSDKDGSLVVQNAKGEKQSVTYGDDIVGQAFSKMAESGSYTDGKDSKFTVTVNGTTKTLTRTTNSAEIDGLTINFKGTFKADPNNPEDSNVTFQTEVQADKVVDQVKTMIAELNVMIAEVREQYATMPVTSSSGSIQSYEPLTDEDMASMSESAIANYEAKAKQGLLFADSNLSALYQGLVSVFNRTGTDRTMMDKMGIGLSYDTSGAATITFDESAFRDALENDFDGVVDIFTRTQENGGGTDGIMQGLKTQLDRYGSTTGAVKGILVQQAGTPLASLSLLDNGWQKEIDNYTDQIDSWADKLESQVDRYTSLFTRLETLINQMNSQSSALAGMLGG